MDIALASQFPHQVWSLEKLVAQLFTYEGPDFLALPVLKSLQQQQSCLSSRCYKHRLCSMPLQASQDSSNPKTGQDLLYSTHTWEGDSGLGLSATPGHGSGALKFNTTLHFPFSTSGKSSKAGKSPIPFSESPPLPLGVSPLVAAARTQTAQIRVWPGCTHSPLIWPARLTLWTSTATAGLKDLPPGTRNNFLIGDKC